MSADSPKGSDETLADDPSDWAWQFFYDLANELHQDLFSLEEFSDEQHAILAQVVGDALLDPHHQVRRAAAWVLGELKFIPEDGIPNLRNLFADQEGLVRMAACWAADQLGEQARELVPELVQCLDDGSSGVRFAASTALGEIGEHAAAAIPKLIELLGDDDDLVRNAALESLGNIAPDDPVVQTLLIKSLDELPVEERVFAISGFAGSRYVPDEAIPLLAQQLEQAQTTLYAAWILGRIGTRAEPIVPELLRSLETFDTLTLDRDAEGPVTVDLHGDLSETLQHVLSEIPDDLLHDFRLTFFRRAFHPRRALDYAWIDDIARHPWFLKLQRARLRQQFGLGRSQADREKTAVLLEDAQMLFAERLWKRPTLGLVPERYRELPGYLRNHARKFASRLYRQHGAKLSTTNRLPLWLPDSASVPDEHVASIELNHAVQNYLDSELPDPLGRIVRLRLFEDWSIERIARTLNTTESKVKTRYKQAMTILQRRFRQ